MISLLGLGKNKKNVKITIEYCPRNITLPYKVKKLINRASIVVPTDEQSSDPFGFREKQIRVGECLNENQLEHLVKETKSGKSDLFSVEIIEGSSQPELLID